MQPALLELVLIDGEDVFQRRERGAGSMSRKIINAILGLASVDQTFCQELIENPLQAVRAKQFVLTSEEEAMFQQISAHNLYEFSQLLLALLDPKREPDAPSDA